MLVLSRHRDESIIVGDDVIVTVVDIRGDKVRLGVAAPPDVPVHRTELYEAMTRDRGLAVSLANGSAARGPSEQARLRAALRAMMHAADGRGDPRAAYRQAEQALTFTAPAPPGDPT